MSSSTTFTTSKKEASSSTSSTHVDRAPSSFEACLQRGETSVCAGMAGFRAFLGSSNERSGAFASTPGVYVSLETSDSKTTVSGRGAVGFTSGSSTEIGAGIASVEYTRKSTTSTDQ